MLIKATGLCISTLGLITLIIVAISSPLESWFYKIMSSVAFVLILGGPFVSLFYSKYNKKRKIALENEELLLEVYYISKKGKQRVMGYIDKNTEFLYPNFKLAAYIEDNKLFFWNNKLIFDLKHNEEIYDDEQKYLGAIKNFHIYDSKGTLYYKYNKNSTEVEDYKGEAYLHLKGNLGVINHIVLLGIMFSYADLFC